MLLDTSILVALLSLPKESRLVHDILVHAKGRPWFVSPIHLGELADAARRSGLDSDAVVAKARQAVGLIPLDADIAVAASSIKAQARLRPAGRNFSLIDGVGLATARSKSMPLLSLDQEFAGLDGAIVLQA